MVFLLDLGHIFHHNDLLVPCLSRQSTKEKASIHQRVLLICWVISSPGTQSIRQGSRRSLSDSEDAAPQPAQGSTVYNTISIPSTAKLRQHYANNACRGKSRGNVGFWDESEKKF